MVPRIGCFGAQEFGAGSRGLASYLNSGFWRHISALRQLFMVLQAQATSHAVMVALLPRYWSFSAKALEPKVRYYIMLITKRVITGSSKPMTERDRVDVHWSAQL